MAIVATLKSLWCGIAHAGYWKFRNAKLVFGDAYRRGECAKCGRQWNTKA